MQPQPIELLPHQDQAPTLASLTSLATALLNRMSAVQAAGAAVMQAAPAERAAQLERLAQAHTAYSQQCQRYQAATQR